MPPIEPGTSHHSKVPTPCGWVDVIQAVEHQGEKQQVNAKYVKTITIGSSKPFQIGEIFQASGSSILTKESGQFMVVTFHKDPNARLTFFDLPAELRTIVYGMVLPSRSSIRVLRRGNERKGNERKIRGGCVPLYSSISETALNFFLVNKAIYKEASRFLLTTNHFDFQDPLSCLTFFKLAPQYRAMMRSLEIERTPTPYAAQFGKLFSEMASLRKLIFGSKRTKVTRNPRSREVKFTFTCGYLLDRAVALQHLAFRRVRSPADLANFLNMLNFGPDPDWKEFLVTQEERLEIRKAWLAMQALLRYRLQRPGQMSPNSSPGPWLPFPAGKDPKTSEGAASGPRRPSVTTDVVEDGEDEDSIKVYVRPAIVAWDARRESRCR